MVAGTIGRFRRSASAAVALQPAAESLRGSESTTRAVSNFFPHPHAPRPDTRDMSGSLPSPVGERVCISGNGQLRCALWSWLILPRSDCSRFGS